MLDRITDNPQDNNTIAGNLARIFNTIGVEIPDRTPDLQPTTEPTDLPAAVREAIAAGKDPATDKKVREQLLRNLLFKSVNINAIVELDQSKARVQHYIDHADTLIEQVTAKFDEAVADIRDNVGTGLSNPDKFDAHDRPAVNIAKAKVIPALQLTGTITGHWSWVLAVLTGTNHRSTPMSFAAWCTPTWAQVTEHKLLGHHLDNGRTLDVYEAIMRSIPVSLATSIPEIRKRTESIQAQREREDENARMSSFGGPRVHSGSDLGSLRPMS